MPFTVKLHNYTTLTFNESSSEISYNASLQSLVTYSKKICTSLILEWDGNFASQIVIVKDSVRVHSMWKVSQ